MIEKVHDDTKYNTVPQYSTNERIIPYRTRTVHEYTIYFIMKNIPGNIIIMIFTV